MRGLLYSYALEWIHWSDFQCKVYQSRCWRGSMWAFPITRDWGPDYVPTCVCESAGEALAQRVSCLAPVSISHIDTSLFPCTAEIIQDGWLGCKYNRLTRAPARHNIKKVIILKYRNNFHRIKSSAFNYPNWCWSAFLLIWKIALGNIFFLIICLIVKSFLLCKSVHKLPIILKMKQVNILRLWGSEQYFL